MAYPSVVQATPTNSAFGTSHTIQVGSVTQNNLLLLIVGVGTSATISNQVLNFDAAGFTVEKYNSEAVSGLIGEYWVLAKAAGVSEPASFSVTTSGAGVSLSAVCIEIQDWYGTASTGVELGVTEYATVQTTTDPPSLTASWGIADTLWFAASLVAGVEASLTTAPSGYTLVDQSLATLSSDASYSVYRLNNNSSATENPSAFVWPTAREGVALTIAVRPAAGVKSRLSLLGAG